MKKVVLLFISSHLFLTVCWAEMASVRGNVVNVRSGPGKSYPALWRVYKGCPVKILKRSGDWVMTKDFEGDVGWIHSSLLSGNRTLIVASQRTSIKGDRANIRSGPGKGFKVLFQLSNKDPAKVLEKDGDWVKIKSQGERVGWIHKSLLTASQTDRVNIRTGPGTDYDIEFKAEEGVILGLLERKGQWLRVKYGKDYVGWIRDDLVWGD